MILYSKNGDFLGIGKDELSFLGFEDLDEFKSVHNDVADLFLNKPGYIFKFKNFSWIDYALHSGAPKKSVIIKLKSGNEVEVPLKIKELFLYSPTQNEDLYYAVEFTNNLSQNTIVSNESTIMQPDSSTQIQTPESFNEKPEKEETLEETIEAQPPQEISFEEDFNKEENEDISIDFNSSEEDKNISIDFNAPEEKQEDEPVLKLRVDDAIYEENEKTDINHDITDDYIKEDAPKIKIYDDEEQVDSTFDITSDYVEENEEIAPDLQVMSTEEKEEDIEVDFDLSQCVDKLGLDISLIGELITDYMDKIDKTIPIIKTSLELNDETVMKENIYMLKGISDNLYMHQLSKKLENILHAISPESKKIELEKFENIVEKFRNELT